MSGVSGGLLKAATRVLTCTSRPDPPGNGVDRVLEQGIGVQRQVRAHFGPTGYTTSPLSSRKRKGRRTEPGSKDVRGNFESFEPGSFVYGYVLPNRNIIGH